MCYCYSVLQSDLLIFLPKDKKMMYYLQNITIAITMEENYCIFLDFCLLEPSSTFFCFVVLTNLAGLSPSCRKACSIKRKLRTAAVSLLNTLLLPLFKHDVFLHLREQFSYLHYPYLILILPK